MSYDSKLYEKIKIIKGDITKLKQKNIDVEAIVNAAKPSLEGGGGVDGAIHKAVGEKLLGECLKIKPNPNRCNSGEAVITSGFELVKYIIHTVGPIWIDGKSNEAKILENCYDSIFKIIFENNIKSVAIPMISTGVYGYPFDKASKIALESIMKNLEKNNSIDFVYIVIFEDKNYKLFKNIKDEY